MSGRRLPGCINCRKRHVRCDRETPACSNCRNAKPPKECTFNALRIRQSVYSTVSEEESETPIPATIAMACRRPEGLVVGGITPESEARQHMSTSVELHATPPVLTAQRGAPFQRYSTSPHPIEDNMDSTLPLNGYGSPSGPCHPARPREDHANPHTPVSGRSGTPISLLSQDSALGSHHSQASGSHRGVTNRLEQMVFEFYIDHAGPWLDIVSSQRHFGETVPRLALAQPVLYAACLAYASNVLCRKGGLAREVYERFHSDALAALIPLLSPTYEPHLYEVLLATTVILRMSEQFSELPEDGLYHLHGANSLFAMAGDSWSPAAVGLKEVAFWTYVRESIRMCFLNEQPCPFDLGMVNENVEAQNTVPEELWANRMTYLIAQLCNACWGDGDPAARALMRRKVQVLLDEWRASIPESFQPWSFTHDRYQAFASIKFFSPWHEIFWQQYYTAKVMLAVYGPRESDGRTILALNQYLNAEIIEPARLACSVCFGSTCVGCGINGAHLISWCGQFFSGKEEQRVLAEFLKEFMNRTKWPNQTCYERLEQIWAGSRRTWAGA